MAWIDTKEESIHYTETGAGDPLVFISGWGGDSSEWLVDMAWFGKHRRCLHLDHPGLAGQPLPSGGYGTRDMALRLGRGLDALGVTSAAVIGMSMGGAVAQWLALERPDLVERLAICGSWARFTIRAARAVELSAGLMRGCDYATGLAMLYWLVFGASFYGKNSKAIEELFAERSASPVPVEVFDYQAKACLEHDTLDRLGKISCPALVTHGLADILIEPSHGKALAKGILDARFMGFEDSGHCHIWEKPDMFRETVLAFLSE